MQNSSFADAARREFLEQTGCEIKILRKIALYSPFGHFSRTTHFFEATIIGKSATLSKKTREVRFFCWLRCQKISLCSTTLSSKMLWIRTALQKKPMPRLYWIRDRKFVYNPCIFAPFLWGRLCWWLTNKPLFK